MIEVDAGGELSEEHVKGLEDALHRCLIHRTLESTPQTRFVINTLLVA